MINLKMMSLKKTNSQKFLLIASSLATGISTIAASYSFLQQMMPDVTCYNDSIIDVNLSNILPGKALLVKWRGSVVVIKNRTQEEIDYAKKIPLSQLKDKLARNPNLPANSLATDEARSAGKNGENWFIYINRCTHLGCPMLDQMAQHNRIFCPCHGSIYDTAGRVLSGPAPTNLNIPPYKFISPQTIRIG